MNSVADAMKASDAEAVNDRVGANNAEARSAGARMNGAGEIVSAPPNAGDLIAKLLEAIEARVCAPSRSAMRRTVMTAAEVAGALPRLEGARPCAGYVAPERAGQ
jgi:hypothetical protein